MTAITDIKLAIDRWTKGRLTLRSSFYTGRDPSASDLNSTMLEGIYQGIKAEVGQTEAINFAKFVANLKDLSASAFIQAFELFWYGGCVNLKETVVTQRERSGHQLTGRDKELFAEGFALIGAALSGSMMSASQIEQASRSIKSQFVFNHKDEIAAN